MAEISAIFFDVGGVLLTNGWDTEIRQRAADKFELDWEEFQERHELISSEFEKGRLTLDQYLNCAVFHRRRNFNSETFKTFLFGQSQKLGDTLELVRQLARSERYRLSTLNNESLELNLFRIEKFQLRPLFSTFFSSCFLGFKKPQREIYRVALQVTQEPAERCLYIDDRALNLENAAELGMRTIHFHNREQLHQEFAQLGVEVGVE